MQENFHYLIELRQRLIRSVLVLGIVFIIFALFANKIYELLALPLLQHFTTHQGLIAISVPAPFLIPFKSAFMASIFVVIPYLLYQLWMFIAPALYQHERHLTWLLLVSSTLLFYIGVLFAYFIVLPLVFKFFIFIAPKGVEVKPDISQYFSFILKMFLAFGFAFELPVAIVLLVWSRVCSIKSLQQKRPYIIVGVFIVGMLLTPPDVVSQILLAVPLWLLFELGLLLAKTLQRP